MLFSLNDISFENVSIGINLDLAIGLISNRISLLNGPIIKLGFILSNNLLIVFLLIFLPVSK